MNFNYALDPDLPFHYGVRTDFPETLQWTDAFWVGLVLRGGLAIQYRETLTELHAHDLCFFPPFAHWLYLKAAPETEVLWIAIDASYVERTCHTFSRLSFRTSFIRKDLKSTLYTSLCRDLSMILRYDLQQGLCTRLHLINTANHLLSTLLESLSRIDEPGRSNDEELRRMSIILNYIADHYAEKISGSDLSQLLGLHPAYFSTLFRREFGTGFVEYLTAYRIHRSIADILRNEKTILEIALDHGFGNHKTYAAAFRKVIGCSPTEYRKSHSPSGKTLEDTPEKESVEASDGILYLRQFLEADRYPEASAPADTTVALEVDTIAAGKKAASLQTELLLSAGRAVSCLNHTLREQIEKAVSEVPVSRLRIVDIFSEELHVYQEDDDHQPVYNWYLLDQVFDFILAHSLTPFPEIGYMPELLAAKNQHAAFQYHPNISRPKSPSAWKRLITEFLRHLIARYGMNEVRSWKFDFWTSPDLDVPNPNWHDGMESFFEFYRMTYEAFHSVDAELSLGTPNFSSISGFPWYEAFFHFCRVHRLAPSHVSIHLYGSEMRIGENEKHPYAVVDPDLIPENLSILHDIMDHTGFSELPVYLSDWGLSFLPSDLIRDTAYMGAFICRTFTRTFPMLKGFCFWSLSDVHDGAFPAMRLFSGGSGMIDLYGLKKASYNAISLLAKLGGRCLFSDEHTLLLQHGSRYQLLVDHLAEFSELYTQIGHPMIDRTHRYQIYRETPALRLSAMLTLPQGTYFIKRWEVSRAHGSAYDLWSKIGFPEELTEDVLSYLEKSSAVPLDCSIREVEKSLLLEEVVPEHGVVLIEIERQ